MTSPYVISPADLMDLRASMRRAIPLDTASHGAFAAPMIIYLPADNAFGLVVNSRMRAVSANIALLGACLRCERAERGWIDRVLDSAEDVRLAALQPDLALAERNRIRNEHARIREAQERAAEASKRRADAAAKNPATLTLDDLLD